MNKALKTGLIISVFALVVVFGYTFTKERSTLTLPISKSGQRTATQNISNIFQNESGGCGNIFVYKTNKDNTVGISVSANKDKLNLSTTEKTFSIEGTNVLSVELLMGENIRFLYCNDVLDPNQTKPKKLLGKTGKAIITISDVDETRPVWGRNYKATVILKDIHFVEENGNNSNTIINDLIFRDIRVGWLPG